MKRIRRKERPSPNNYFDSTKIVAWPDTVEVNYFFFRGYDDSCPLSFFRFSCSCLVPVLKILRTRLKGFMTVMWLLSICMPLKTAGNNSSSPAVE